MYDRDPIIEAMAKAGYCEAIARSDGNLTPEVDAWENQTSRCREDWRAYAGAMAAAQAEHITSYWVAHALEKADGSLLVIAPSLPKTWKDPGLAQSTLMALAKAANMEPEAYGRVVEISLIRLGPYNRADEKLRGSGDAPAQPPAARPAWLAVCRSAHGEEYQTFRIEYDANPREYEKGRGDSLVLIERVQLPDGFTGGLMEAAEWWRQKQPAKADAKAVSNAG